VYTAIKQDLDDALPALLDKTPNTFRPAKNVAYGFLARMYLMHGEYDKALENAKKALEVSEELVDLTEYTAKPNAYIGRIVRKDDPSYWIFMTRTWLRELWINAGNCGL